MDEAEEIFIATETERLQTIRHWGLTVFMAVSLVILGVSLVTMITNA